jgi:hypothetical protein
MCEATSIHSVRTSRNASQDGQITDHRRSASGERVSIRCHRVILASSWLDALTRAAGPCRHRRGTPSVPSLVRLIYRAALPRTRHCLIADKGTECDAANWFPGNSCVDVHDVRDQPDCIAKDGRGDHRDPKGNEDPRGGRKGAPPRSPHGRTGMIVFPGVGDRVEGGDGISRVRRPRRASPHGAEKSGSVARSCRGVPMSGGLSHCRSLVIVDNVSPESIGAAAHDVACRASKVNILAVGTFAIN